MNRQSQVLTRRVVCDIPHIFPTPEVGRVVLSKKVIHRLIHMTYITCEVHHKVLNVRFVPLKMSDPHAIIQVLDKKKG